MNEVAQKQKVRIFAQPLEAVSDGQKVAVVAVQVG